MPAYDATRFDPPAPLVFVTLRNPNTGSVCPDVPLLLDGPRLTWDEHRPLPVTS
jgi:hypothetical protein